MKAIAEDWKVKRRVWEKDMESKKLEVEAIKKNYQEMKEKFDKIDIRVDSEEQNKKIKEEVSRLETKFHQEIISLKEEQQRYNYFLSFPFLF